MFGVMGSVIKALGLATDIQTLSKNHFFGFRGPQIIAQNSFYSDHYNFPIGTNCINVCEKVKNLFQLCPFSENFPKVGAE